MALVLDKLIIVFLIIYLFIFLGKNHNSFFSKQ